MPTDQEIQDFLASFDQPGAGAPPAAATEGRDLLPPAPSAGGGNPYWLGGADQNGVPAYSPQNPPPLPMEQDVTRNFTDYVARNTAPQYAGPPMPPVTEFGQDRGFGPSYGSGMGPGNEATGQQVFGANLPQEQRFGDAGNGYQLGGYREMGPMLSDIAAGTSRIGAGIGRGMGDLGLGGVLGRMFDLGQQRGMIDRGTSRPDWTQRWIDDAMQNNLRTVTPELQADGSIQRVYGYENGRRQGEPYQAAPPPKPVARPAAPYVKPAMPEDEGGGVLATFGLDRVRDVPGSGPILETFDHTTGTWTQAKDSAGKPRVITDPKAVVADMNRRAETLQASVNGQPMPELPPSTAMSGMSDPAALAADLSNPVEGQVWINAKGETFIYTNGQWTKVR